MKTVFLTLLALLPLGMAMAENDNESLKINTIVVNTTGNVTLKQGTAFQVDFDMDKNHFTSDWNTTDTVLYLNGTGDFKVVVEELNYLDIRSVGDVSCDGMLKGQSLSVGFFSTGDSKLSLDYKNVYVGMHGTGDLELQGGCDALFVENRSTGDLDAKKLNHVLSLANIEGLGDVRLGASPKYMAYHAVKTDGFKQYSDTGYGIKCSQSDRVKLQQVDGLWKLNTCEPTDRAVIAVLQNAGAFFATESQRSWHHGFGRTNDRDNASSLAGLSDLLSELGTNLEHLADSVDWESFADDMERWGQSMEEWGRHMEEWAGRFEREMDRLGRDVEREARDMERWGNGKPDYVPQPDVKVKRETNQGRMDRPMKRSLLFDPHWSGFEAGLNMLLGPGTAAGFEGPYSFLEQKPMKSWVFNFNIADVGIAFNRRHIGGLYTGIGLGWNNYSFNHPVRLYKTEDHRLEGEWIDEVQEGKVKKSKLGVLYVQAPLMIEMRPARNFHIAAGVVGGIRVDAWNKVKFIDKSKETSHSDFYLNLLKLDAELRAGGDDMGFFASFNLLPLFYEANGPTAHTLCFGFSLLF